MNIRDIKNLLKQFFQGTPSKGGDRLVDEWYHFYDDKPEELHSLRSDQKKELKEEIWENIRKSAGLTTPARKWERVGYRQKDRAWPYKLAAGFAVILLALLPVFLFAPQTEIENVVEYQTSSNPAGTSSRLTLADGSVIWLSANSSLRYPADFSQLSDGREVFLEGEAFFDVVSDPEKPFIVHSENLRTTVLGTSFNIRAFEEEQDIKITVTTGKVAVEESRPVTESDQADRVDFALLETDQQLVFNRITRQADTHRVNSELYTSWKNGELTFENQTFAEIAVRLESWYGVKIHFADRDMEESRFRINFTNRSLEHALNMLQVIGEFEYDMNPEEKQVWIR